MSHTDPFRRGVRTGTYPTSSVAVLHPDTSPAVGSREFCRRMEDVGASFRKAGVDAVYLVHGALDDPDLFRAAWQVMRVFWPPGKSTSKPIHREDRPPTEAASYSDLLAGSFAAAINPPGARRIPVRLFEWSGENHHLGRADGAVRLIDELAARDSLSGNRVLLWGHGQAGDVLALMTNLLGGNRQTIDRFFRATEVYYRWPIIGCVDVPVWDRVHKLLCGRNSLPSGPLLDVVTFGASMRYQWDSAGYSRLMRFIDPASMNDPSKNQPSREFDQTPSTAAHDQGDQEKVVTADLVPNCFAWRVRPANRRLRQLLQSDDTEVFWPDQEHGCPSAGEAGTTVSVDYGLDDPANRRCSVETVCARPDLLLFHAEQVVRHFYATEDREAA